VKSTRACLYVPLLFVFVSTIAQAQSDRTWVSGVGDDANSCGSMDPCKTFAGAISKTNAGGEIDVLSPGGFGAVTITKAITIDGGGEVSSILASGTIGVIVNADTNDVVTLRNLSINGTGTTRGTNGIKLMKAKALHVENCTISNFSSRGIDIEPSTGGQVFVLNTVSRDNGESGIRAIASSTKVFVTIDKSRFENNAYGVWAGDFSRFVIRDSDASGNSQVGFISQANSGDVILNAVNSTASNNIVTGIQAGGGTAFSIVRLAGSSILSNAVNGMVAGSNGSIVSIGDNYNSGSGAPTSTVSFQ
jgi:Right handed beta helix region